MRNVHLLSEWWANLTVVRPQMPQSYVECTFILTTVD